MYTIPIFNTILPGKIMSPPNRILWTGESAGLSEVYLLKQAISETWLNGLLTQILQRGGGGGYNNTILPGKIMSSPNRILWTGESAGLSEVYLLKQAISEAGLNGLLTQIHQRGGGLIIQFYLVRSCLLQIESCELVRVLAWVRSICWNRPFLRQESMAFLHKSSRGTLDSAPTSFSSISAVTFRPSDFIIIHKMKPRIWDGKPITWNWTKQTL